MSKHPLSRRQFLQRAAALGAASLGAGSLLGCRRTLPPEETETPPAQDLERGALTEEAPRRDEHLEQARDKHGWPEADVDYRGGGPADPKSWAQGREEVDDFQIDHEVPGRATIHDGKDASGVDVAPDVMRDPDAEIAGLRCDINELTQQERSTRLNYAYTEPTPRPAQRCEDCLHFLEPKAKLQCGGCHVVPGQIHPQGWCRAWVARDH